MTYVSFVFNRQQKTGADKASVFCCILIKRSLCVAEEILFGG
jgi:hypothetical protein